MREFSTSRDGREEGELPENRIARFLRIFVSVLGALVRFFLSLFMTNNGKYDNWRGHNERMESRRRKTRFDR